MVTYLDIAEILREYFPPDYSGILLEVGAAHPTMASVSFPFRQFNWNIISVEPNPEFINNFKELNLPILEYAACAEDKGTTTFKISPNSFSCSSLGVKENYKGYLDWTDDDFRTIEVQALKLNTILEKHHPNLKSIDILLVDVEGWEIEVLEGFDLERFNPKVICLENYSASPEYVSYLRNRGYKLNRKEAQDDFYIKCSEADYLNNAIFDLEGKWILS